MVQKVRENVKAYIIASHYCLLQSQTLNIRGAGLNDHLVKENDPKMGRQSRKGKKQEKKRMVEREKAWRRGGETQFTLKKLLLLFSLLLFFLFSSFLSLFFSSFFFFFFYPLLFPSFFHSFTFFTIDSVLPLGGRG